MWKSDPGADKHAASATAHEDACPDCDADTRSDSDTDSCPDGNAYARGAPPEPQEITFQAADGQELHGLYYPAAQQNAPLVVLIHWVNGDQSDWYEVAPWLQNRGLANPFANPGTKPWWDPSWFPPLPEGASYGVFIFSLRTCTPFPEGCWEWLSAEWYLDIQAAMLKATELEGVDPTRIVAIGSSIGADGAADGCQWLNADGTGVCLGALSLSPGDYLEIPYADVVQDLCEQEQPKTVWCLADAANEVQFCQQAGEYPTYQVYGIPHGGHGNRLLQPGLDPLPMQLILDFLGEALGE